MWGQALKNILIMTQMCQVMIKYLCNLQIMQFKKMVKIMVNLRKATLTDDMRINQLEKILVSEQGSFSH